MTATDGGLDVTTHSTIRRLTTTDDDVDETTTPQRPQNELRHACYMVEAAG